MHEFLTFAVFYAVAIGGDILHGHVKRAARRRRLARLAAERDAESLDAISPLHREVPRPRSHRHTRHVHYSVIAAALAHVFHPASFDAVKDYVIHLVIYSGYIIPH